MTYSWEREECHKCKLWQCCEGLDELRKKVDGVWEEHCTAFDPRNEMLEQKIMDCLNEDDGIEPILSRLIPKIMDLCPDVDRKEITESIIRLNKEHRFSMGIDRNLDVRCYIPLVAKCSRCGHVWDATNYDSYGGGLYYTGFRLDKESLCRDCEEEIISDWYARGKPELKNLWGDE